MSRIVEVRVQGQLGDAMLRLLGWSHVTVPEQTIIRLDTTPAGLHSLLRDCTERGLAIERVHRVGGAVAPPPPVPSRDPARDPDGPRRPSG